MEVCEQDRVSKTIPDESRKACKHTYTNVGCNFVFTNKMGLKCHAGRCKCRDYYLVERMLDVCGEIGTPKRQFLTRWNDCESEYDRCVNRADQT